jgi:hypothetical protein
MNFLCSLQRRKVTEFRARENVRTNHRQSHQIRTGGIILSCEKSVEFLVEYGMLICSPHLCIHSVPWNGETVHILDQAR